MNKWVSIIEKIQSSIVVCSDDKIISEGTGTMINRFGAIITARHVVGMYDDYVENSSNSFIYVFTSKGRFTYKIVSSPFFWGSDLGGGKKIEYEVDLAILEPIQLLFFEDYTAPVTSHLNIKLGMDMLLCGYSEETHNHFDPLIIAKKVLGKELSVQMQNELNMMNGSIIPATYKSGIVANTSYVYAGNVPFHMQYLHIDNGVHRGMSGGPIIDSSGRFIGIITMRTVIGLKVDVDRKFHDFDIPSGNSIGFTLNFLDFITRQNKGKSFEEYIR